jgi:ribulose-phosphate 3-epimerase
MLDELPHQPLLEVDGGVNLKNIGDIAQAGTDVIVAGNAVFGSGDYEKNIAALKTIANSH